MSKMHVAKPSLTKLFEKKLSATDVSHKGRLVVPKAYAETYFPPLSQPEGKPLKIRDIKGKEWEFQYKFFLTRNCKIYALDGPSVTGFMQSMRLQAGDFVTFNHSGPEKKLVMGYYHEASSSTAIQGPLQLCKPSVQKRGRKSGAKSKPLLNDSVVDPELKINWEEAQELLRSPQSERSFVELNKEVIEEFDELPVSGKKSVFVSRETGVQEQWVQCDTCEKWRRVHVDTFLPPNWSCSDNLLDPVRSSCSAPDEDSPRELIQQIQESKRRRFESSNEELNQVQKALALVTTKNVGIIINDREGENTVAATTKQPRHQARCSCTVCSQPLIANGKHKVSCTCTECETRKGQCEARKGQCETPRTRKRQRGEAGPSQLVRSEIRDETEREIIPAVEPAAVRGEAGQILKKRSLGMQKRKRGDAGQTSQKAQSGIRNETQLRFIPAVEPAAVRGEAGQITKKRSLRMQKRRSGDAGQTSQQAQSGIRDETQLRFIPAVEPASVRGLAGQTSQQAQSKIRDESKLVPPIEPAAVRGEAGETSQQAQSVMRDETQLPIIPAVEPATLRVEARQKQAQSDIRDETQLQIILANEPAAVREEAAQTNQQAQSAIRDETQMQIIPPVEPATVRNIDLNSTPVEAIDLNAAPVRNIDLNSDPVEE